MGNKPTQNVEHTGIRDGGYDEYWLQDFIYDNPACLGLGELEPVAKEKPSGGGRLDILLKHPEDDTMFEVEVMLGDTDESHIIRTIEYWDSMKRKWPQRQHFAVLVSENVTRRFFNVIHHFSHSIPFIAIQVQLLTIDDKVGLHFTKIIDTYEEPDDGSSDVYTEQAWRKKADWTVDTALAMQDIVKDVYKGSKTRYLKGYIAINDAGTNCIWLKKRSSPKSLINFGISPKAAKTAHALLDEQNVPYNQTMKSLNLTVDKDFILNNKELLVSLARLVDKRRKNYNDLDNQTIKAVS